MAEPQLAKPEPRPESLNDLQGESSAKASGSPDETFRGGHSAEQNVLAKPIDESILAGMSEDEQKLTELIYGGNEVPNIDIIQSGWIHDLRSMQIEHPPDIKKMLRGGARPKDQPKLLEYAKGVLGWRDTVSGVKEAQKQKTEKVSEAWLLKLLEKIEKDRGSRASILLKREAQDIEMTPEKSGWGKYWLNRLRPEADLLPERIRKIVLESHEDKIPESETLALGSYIFQRIRVLKFDLEKRGRMELLHNQLRAIDSGEPVFPPESIAERRPVFWDEDAQTFYVVENDKRRNLGIGDIVSDYAWEIKYFADDKLPPKIKRLLQKRIVVNEAHREIEHIYNKELSKSYGISRRIGDIMSIADIEANMKSDPRSIPGLNGIIAERAILEFLNRVSIKNPELGFIVERSSVLEDAGLKYDFKIRIKQKLRGVAVEGEELRRAQYVKEKRRVGIQFTIGKHVERKQLQVNEAKLALAKLPKEFLRKGVMDIVLLRLKLEEMKKCFNVWLKNGRPSGGPEQYISTAKKREVLECISKNFIPLTEEQIEKAISS